MKPRQEPNETSQSTKPKPIQPPTKDRKRNYPRIGKAMAKKVIPYILVGCIASSAVMMSFNEAEEVKAEAISITALTVCALLAVMATMGITYATQNILETWEDGNNALDPDYEDIYDTWKEGYNAEWKVLEGGGDNNEDLPPDFDILMKQIEIAGNTAVITASAWNLLKKSGKNFLEKSYELGTLFADATIPDGMNVAIEDINSSVYAIFHSDIYMDSANKCKDVILYGTGPFCLIKNDKFSYVYMNPYINDFKCSYYKDGTLYSTRPGNISHGIITYLLKDPHEGSHKAIVKHPVHGLTGCISKYPTFSTDEEALNYMLQFWDGYTPNRQDEPIWVTPELQDTYKNKGQFEFPENLPNPLRVPNIGDLQELARRLNPDSNPDYNPEEIPEYIKQYINNLKVDPNPDPEPNPLPEPDPGNPDNPDIPTNNDTFLADLKHLFPFCIPFDLVDCFKLFNAEPVTPRVEFPVHFGIINYDHTFVIDLKDFNNVAVVCRSTFLIIYMTGLILATRALIKG